MSEPVPVKPAATLLLVRDGDDGLEVFMVVRHHKIDFASGALVFPGGKVDPDDFVIAADDSLCGATQLEPSERAFRIAAARETFEECGVLLARERGSQTWLAGERMEALAAAAKGRLFSETLKAEGLELALDALVPFAHWVTPPILPKRFDTRFFIVAAPLDQLAAHDGSESVDSVWISPARAIADGRDGRFSLVFATELNLKMLGESADVETALAAARARKIVTVEPIPTRTAEGYTMRIPLEAGYGGDVFDMAKTA